MSILIKSSNGSGGIGGTGKGFPPGDVKIITKFIANNTLKIKWEDPEDTVLNGSTICTWAGTVLVAKEGSCPESIKDGTVLIESTTKNAYKDQYFTCSTTASVLYLRFFTYSTEKVYNNNISMLCITAADPVLANNPWDVISAVSEAGDASTIWSIGDEIDIQFDFFAATYNPFTLQIWDFDHFDKSDGSGKAGIVFGCKKISVAGIEGFAGSSTDYWTDSYFRKSYGNATGSFFKKLPLELKKVIKEVTIYTNEHYYSTDGKSNVAETNDLLFIPGIKEVLDGYTSSATSKQFMSYGSPKQSKFPIFTDDASRSKVYHNPDSSYASSASWWLRDRTDSSAFGRVDKSGLVNQNSYSASYNGYLFCFNV